MPIRMQGTAATAVSGLYGALAVQGKPVEAITEQASPPEDIYCTFESLAVPNFMITAQNFTGHYLEMFSPRLPVTHVQDSKAVPWTEFQFS